MFHFLPQLNQNTYFLPLVGFARLATVTPGCQSAKLIGFQAELEMILNKLLCVASQVENLVEILK